MEKIWGNRIISMKNINDILELFDIIKAPYFCDYKTLKKCFRREIKKHHPDISGDEEKAKTIIIAFKKLEKIYQDNEKLNYYKHLFESKKNDIPEETSIKHKSITRLITRTRIFGIIVLILFVIFLVLTNDFLTGLLTSVGIVIVIWGYKRLWNSGQWDLNPRPHAPEACALAICAMARLINSKLVKKDIYNLTIN